MTSQQIAPNGQNLLRAIKGRAKAIFINTNWGVALLGLTAATVLLERFSYTVQRIYAQASNFAGVAIDGAFQLYNPLRRLAAGQIPGVDFQFFHGLGTMLVHYPLFAIFGKNLFASELSRETITPLFFVVSAAVVLYVATNSFVATLVGTALLLLLHPWMATLTTPAGSLLGVRSTMPLLVAAALILLHRQQAPRRVFVFRMIVLTLLALSFFMSVEQGMAAIAAYVLVNGIFGEDGWMVRFVHTLRDIAIVCLVTLLGFAIASHGHPLEPLLYSLRDVPKDQFWYFGVPPNGSLLSLRDILSYKLLMACWAAGVLQVVLLARLRLPKLRPTRFGFLFLLAYGLIATFSVFGIQLNAYIEPLIRIILLATVSFGYMWTQRQGWGAVIRAAYAVGLVGILVALWALPDLPHHQAAASNINGGMAVSGTHLNRDWQEHLENFNDVVPRGAELWSTYSSLVEAQRGTFDPSGYDYIIHALGPDRRNQYVQKFVQERPEFVNTIRRAYYPFGVYEEWLEMSHWNLYEWLALNYEYKASTAFSHIWKRKPEWKDPSSVGWLDEVKDPRPDMRLIMLPADLPEGSVVTVQVDYEITDKLGFLPIAGKMPRYYVAAYDSANSIPASLPPYEHTWEFPVVTKAGQAPRMYFYVGSVLPGAHLHVKALRYRVLPLREATRKAIVDLPPVAD